MFPGANFDFTEHQVQLLGEVSPCKWWLVISFWTALMPKDDQELFDEWVQDLGEVGK